MPIKVHRICFWVGQYGLERQGQLLLQGFSKGFELGYNGPRERRWAENLPYILGKEELVRLKLEKEVDEGRMEGPFSDWPLENLIVSPIGVVPKKEPGQYRLIHHLSWPEGVSVNYLIPEELTKVSYASVDVAMALVEALGPSTLMATTDIKSAFRLLLVHPQDFKLLGIQFQGSWYVDQALCIGCSISCSLFECFSTFLQWIFVQVTGHASVTHYLYDLFLAGPRESDSCKVALENFQSLMGDLGVPLAPEKTVGPCTALSFLGIELDTVDMVTRLPGEKKRVMLETVRSMIQKRKVAVKEIEALLLSGERYDGGSEKKRGFSVAVAPSPFLVAETDNGHMTDENGWEENMTRQLQIGQGWTVAGLRR
ncbi:hypothetical protein NDU88_001513 [Pleurodeles waltl]|uniref:ribonuclease H n=1 Tax=Pleurodeles waltl TaxID=8319 RepID=A0AAV7L9Q8_PLEWA|nr:hypothetical protein NDU88_001513 [Pleurodeles waltl]